MPSINKAIILGYLGQDPEIKYTNQGDAVCNFSIATSEKWKDKDGKQAEKTEWHKIIVWKKLAEICSQYLSKGSLVYVEGRIQTRKWQDKNGQDKQSTEIIAKDVTFLSSKKDSIKQEQQQIESGKKGDRNDTEEAPF